MPSGWSVLAVVLPVALALHVPAAGARPALPVVQVQPASGATVVRPDATITVRMDATSPRWRSLRQRFAHGLYGLRLCVGDRLVAALTPGDAPRPGDGREVRPAADLAFAEAGDTVTANGLSLAPFTTYTATLATVGAGLPPLPALDPTSDHRDLCATIDRPDAFTWSFTTGSAIGEPTHLRVAVQTSKPSVIGGDVLSIAVSDDYGDPATIGSLALSVTGSGAAVSPDAVVFGSSQPARSIRAIVTDHRAGSVAVTVTTAGPSAAHDAHAMTIPLAFQPGPPADITLSAPASLDAGGRAIVDGAVRDAYGNPVADGTVLQLTASQGAIQSPVDTTAGGYQATFTAPSRLEGIPGAPLVVDLGVGSVSGAAAIAGTVRVTAGAPARIALDLPAVVTPSSVGDLHGSVWDAYGNAVVDGTAVSISLSGNGDPQTMEGITTEGTFSVPVMWSGPGLQTVAVTAGSAQQTGTEVVTNPVPTGSRMTVDPPQSVDGSERIAGSLLGPDGRGLPGVVVSLRIASGSGDLASSAVVTTTSGSFGTLLTPGATGAVVDLAAGSHSAETAVLPAVSGVTPWTATDVRVQPGQEVWIQAAGLWATSLRARVATAGPAVPVGADGGFVVGAPTAGTLYLGPGGAAASGSLQAGIVVSDPPGQPELRLAASPSVLAANGQATSTLTGRLMVGTVPVIGAAVALQVGAGALGNIAAVTAADGSFWDVYTAGTVAGTFQARATWAGQAATANLYLVDPSGVPTGFALAGSPYFPFSDAPQVVSGLGTSTVVIAKPQTETPTDGSYPYAPGGGDIMYGQQVAPYTMTLPSGILASDVQSATLEIGAVLDDHASEPTDSYTGSIVWDGQTLFSGTWPLPHGTPYNSAFDNWQTLRYDVTDLLGASNTLVIRHNLGLAARDWVGIDAVRLILQLKG